MSLQVWLPLNGSLENKGLATAYSTNSIVEPGATVSTNGKIGSCYEFDGSASSFIYAAYEFSNTPIGDHQNFSVAMWLYYTQGASDGAYVLTDAVEDEVDDVLTETANFIIKINASNTLRFYWNESSYWDAGSVTKNVWTHIIYTYDGSTLSLYINGSKTSTYSVSIPQLSSTTHVCTTGLNPSTGSNTLTGRINDLRIYDNCLTDKEVRYLAQGLVLHYPMNQELPSSAVHATICDNSGYGYDGIADIGRGMPTSTDTPRYSLSTDLSAQNGFITMDNATLFPALTSCTVSWWGNYNSAKSLLLAGQTESYYVAAGDPSFHHSGATVGTYYVDGVAQSGAPSYVAGQWHHYAITGVDISTWTQFMLNNYGEGGSWYINGLLSDFRIYATALSAADVKELYQSSAALTEEGDIFSFDFLETTSIGVKKANGFKSSEFIEGQNRAIALESKQFKARNLIER